MCKPKNITVICRHDEGALLAVENEEGGVQIVHAWGYDPETEAIYQAAQIGGSEFAVCNDAAMVIERRADIVRKIATTGYAADNAEYLGANLDGTMADYLRYLAGETERYRLEQIYRDSDDEVIEAVALCHLAGLYGDYLDTDAYASVMDALSQFGRYSDLVDIRDAAERAYAAALK